MGPETGKLKKTGAAVAAAAFWLLVWQLLAMLVGQEVVLSPPLTVFRTLIRLMGTADFWLSLGATILRILLGYGLGVLLGTALACVCWKSALSARQLWMQ